MKELSLLLLTLPMMSISDELIDEYINLARIREVSPDSFELVFDLNTQLAAQCEYTVPAKMLFMSTDYFAFLRGYTSDGRGNIYHRALSSIRCDDPMAGFQKALNQPGNPSAGQ